MQQLGWLKWLNLHPPPSFCLKLKLWGKADYKVWDICWYSSACDVFRRAIIKYLPKGTKLLHLILSRVEFVCSVVLCRSSWRLEGQIRTNPLSSKWHQYQCSYSKQMNYTTYWRLTVSYWLITEQEKWQCWNMTPRRRERSSHTFKCSDEGADSSASIVSLISGLEQKLLVTFSHCSEISLIYSLICRSWTGL